MSNQNSKETKTPEQYEMKWTDLPPMKNLWLMLILNLIFLGPWMVAITSVVIVISIIVTISIMDMGMAIIS